MIELSLGTIAGGKLEAAVREALAKVAHSFENGELDDLPRKLRIDVQVKLDKSRRFVTTVHTVRLELPTKKEAGVAFLDGDTLLADEAVVGSNTQRSLFPPAPGEVKSAPNVVEIGKGKAAGSAG
jgi:hypothetical protein